MGCLFMSRKNSVAIVTIISAFLFCAMIVAASLSQLVGTGGASNQFNSVGMWSAIGMILVLYFIPFLIYMLGVDAMRYVMVDALRLWAADSLVFCRVYLDV